MSARPYPIFRLFFALFLGFSATACAAPAKTFGPSETFDYAGLKGRAQHLASQPYDAHDDELPKALQNLSWDQYQQLVFDGDQALWKKDQARFRAELFHLGLFFKRPIHIYQLSDGVAEEIAYDNALFDYGESGVKGAQLPKDLGFAGFRFKFHTDWQRDVVAFLGASYFRAVGGEMQYGMSARGLAIDTALNRAEEFPVFTHFWLETPAKNSEVAVVYALLDSPSATGAYRFEIRPGDNTVMDVDVAIYPRKAIERLGIAPLTSMYMIGENSRRTPWDWRPEIHDSDGLAMKTGAGQWLWRPLVNPRQLRFNAYADENPGGFGLLQRDRDFDHYQDDGVFYEQRPGVWVEPRGHWGKGQIQLVEIPTEDETFDNIVAFWKPDRPVEAGQELLFSYRLSWGSEAPQPENLATVVNTFTGLGGVVGKKRETYSKRFVVDFQGGRFAMLGDKIDIKPVIESSAGRIELSSLRPQHHINGYRAMFDIVPPAASSNGGAEAPINLRLHLEIDGQPVTETWIYQWTPPPAEQRQLHNPGHL